MKKIVLLFLLISTFAFSQRKESVIQYGFAKAVSYLSMENPNTDFLELCAMKLKKRGLKYVFISKEKGLNCFNMDKNKIQLITLNINGNKANLNMTKDGYNEMVVEAIKIATFKSVSFDKMNNIETLIFTKDNLHFTFTNKGKSTLYYLTIIKQ